jgi:aminotransferase class I and II
VRTAERMRRELADLERRSQLRSLEVAPDLDFSSNDYIGLSVDPRLKQAVSAALAGDESAAATGSRLLSGHSERWTELESDFAQWIGAEAALFFTSGYLANVGLLAAVLSSEDTVFSDSANHASLIDGIRLSRARRVVFPHGDLNFLEDALRGDSARGARFIVVESVFSMDGDRAPLAELVALAERHGAEWMKRTRSACWVPAGAAQSLKQAWRAAPSPPSVPAAKRSRLRAHSFAARRHFANFSLIACGHLFLALRCRRTSPRTFAPDGNSRRKPMWRV